MAWSTFSSASGTCLYAARWKATSGFVSRNSAASFRSSRTSANTQRYDTSGCRSSSRARKWNSDGSWLSRTISDAGFRLARNVERNDPTEPPAPETSSRRPPSADASAPRSKRTSGRPSSDSAAKPEISSGIWAPSVDSVLSTTHLGDFADSAQVSPAPSIPLAALLKSTQRAFGGAPASPSRSAVRRRCASRICTAWSGSGSSVSVTRKPAWPMATATAASRSASPSS